MLLRRMYELIVKVEKPALGRWNLKSCNEISTSINSVYQNRDHCGDTICKTPKKALEYTTHKHFSEHTHESDTTRRRSLWCSWNAVARLNR